MVFAVFQFLLTLQATSALLFSCVGRPTGYYADISSQCQQYHVCTGGRLHFTYTCPNTTRFQQRMMICDHDYRVDCLKSEQDFSVNLLIGKQGVPFVTSEEIQLKRSVALTSSPPPSVLNVIPTLTPKQWQISNKATPIPSNIRQLTTTKTIFNSPIFSNIQTFVTTISPIQDYPISHPPQWLRNIKEASSEDNSNRRSSVRLEWTLPDTRAMLFIPDDPADSVEPNIKKYSITIPKPKMIFKLENTNTSCPCDSRFLKNDSCNCITVK